MDRTARDGRAVALTELALDLHIHTVVSACAEIEMIPPLIVRRALELGLDLIAITDHNTAENVEAVQEAARGTALKVLPGMEVQTSEEVHILCLFDTSEQISAWQATVLASGRRPWWCGASRAARARGADRGDRGRAHRGAADVAQPRHVRGRRRIRPRQGRARGPGHPPRRRGRPVG